MLRKNYHTHTYRCGHARGDVADYCRAAVEQGLEVLGISDHTPLPDGRWNRVRMGLDELPGYCRAIDEARANFPALRILKGMECEYDEPFANFYRDELLGRWSLDYLIGAVHYFPGADGAWYKSYGHIDDAAALRAYTKHCLATMRSGLFTFLAHPDVFGNCYPEWDAEAEACAKAILETAQDLRLPLELNAYGLRKPRVPSREGERAMYPWNPFWALAEDYDIRVVVNSDAHRPEDVGDLAQAVQVARRYSLHFADFSYLERNLHEPASTFTEHLPGPGNSA